MAKKPVLRYRSVILSDIHLGTNDCKADEVHFLLKHIHCDTLILNGDIIDGWSLKRRNIWPKSHTRVVRRILKLAEKKDINVIYLRGNHDDFLAHYLPLAFDRLRLAEEHILNTPHGDYLIVHGDCFDAITTHSKFIAVLGDIGYQGLLRLNRLHNRWRSLRGKEYYSLSKAIKARVKSAVSHIGKFEEHLQTLAAKRGCRGIICGHIHTPEDKQVGSIHYLNSGDWVESLSAVVEHLDGRMEVIYYQDFRAQITRIQEEREKATQDSQSIPASSPSKILWLSEEEEEQLLNAQS